MYVTAHRVLSPDRARQAINAFYYIHNRDWAENEVMHFLPDSNHGTLMDDMIQLSPPGNTVRSYLDIVAPDSIRTSILVSSFEELLDGLVPDKCSFVRTIGNVWFRFGIELGLAPAWRQEIEILFQHAIALASRHMVP